MVAAGALLVSRSHQDVAEIAQEPPTVSPPGSSLGRKQQDGDVPHGACQEHENEPAQVVIVCEPEGTSLMMGGLHPR